MAITVTVADIQARLPEFSKLDPDSIRPWLNSAIRCVSATQWAGLADDAVTMLAGHLLSLFLDPDCIEPAAGPVTSEREGQVATTYKISDRMAEDDLGTTKYGRRFITMRRKIFVTRKI